MTSPRKDRMQPTIRCDRRIHGLVANIRDGYLEAIRCSPEVKVRVTITSTNYELTFERTVKADPASSSEEVAA